MATVKSLEERLDDFSEELSEVKAGLGSVGSQVATLANNQAAAQLQLAGFAVKLDGLADKLNATQAQIAALTSALATTQAQLAVLTAKLDSLAEDLRATNVRLDALTVKLDAVVTEHATLKARGEATETRARETADKVATVAESHGAFRAKTETTFGMLRWAGAFAAATLVTVIFAAFAMIRAAGSLEANIQQQQKSIEEIKRDVADIRARQKS